MNLLLVCSDPAWTQAVHDALGTDAVDTCDARGALTRLARTMPNYSHLLLQPQCDDGLFDALLQLTSEAAGSATELLMLGGQVPPRPDLNIIRFATSRSVQEALMVAPHSRRRPQAPINLAEVQQALDRGMIRTRYQPIVRMRDRRPVALEVLARLDHPEQGTVLPDRFVPMIEDAGLAERLTELVAERAFTDLAAPDIMRHGLFIGLNFPLEVVMRPEAMEKIDAQRQAAGIPADRVAIELTESRPVQDFAALRIMLERARALGYRAAIDDVAPSVPGLDQLLTLPFTSLKFDKDLVAQAGSDGATRRFMEATIDRAHHAGMAVVAEGVETTEIWRLMRSLCVDAAQGYLLARPLPTAAVPVWLDAWPTNPSFD